MSKPARLTIQESEKLFAETQLRIRGALGFFEAEHVLALMREGLASRKAGGAGWKLMPPEATLKMKQAGYIAWLKADKTQVYGEAIADHCYQAMRANSPEPPLPPDAGGAER